MRRLSIVAAMSLLMACGGTQSDNAAPVGSDVPGNTMPAAGEPGEAGTQPANAVVPGADGDNGAVSPCLVQGTERLNVEPLRAIGTEPFWSARVEGRCVTYSTPEKQQGTRIWTRYSQGADGGVWIGQLGGKGFELRTRAAPGCSDGMSDERYPIAVELLVNDEKRSGCAEKL